MVTPERLARFDLILAGDDVKNKKPDPEIYNAARARLGVDPARCLVIEDSMVGREGRGQRDPGGFCSLVWAGGNGGGGMACGRARVS